MTAPPVIIVAGFGRCGTSLVLQMLHLAGVDCHGDWPSFEQDRRQSISEFDGAWLAEQGGRAVKVLDPHAPSVDLSMTTARTIWLDRDPVQQANSQAKMLTEMAGQPVSRQGRRGLASVLRRDRAAALAAVQACGMVLPVHFEALLANPQTIATAIAGHVCDVAPALRGKPLGRIAQRMAAAVVERSPDCYPGWLERELIGSRLR